MVSATFTSRILTHFEDALASLPILVAFVPQLMDTGGNAGGQASVSVIRALSLGDIQMKDFMRVLWKEFRVALLCGLTLAVVNFVKMMIFNDVSRSVYGVSMSLIISAVVCVTIALAVVIAKVIGSMLPILAKRIGFDPAVMASPLITTIVDVVSLLVYFLISTTVLSHAGLAL